MSRFDPAIIAVGGPVSQLESLSLGLSLPVRMMLALAGGFLMGVPWFDQELYWTAWVGCVPLLFALHQVRLPTALMLGWLNGIAYFAVASYWIVEFLMNLRDFNWSSALLLGFLFWCYAGLSVALSCLLFRWVSRRLPAWDLLSFPVCMVVIMGFYPLLFGVYYAEAQARFLLALQGVSLFGVQSLDMLMLMTSMLVFQLLTLKQPALWPGKLAGALVLVVWFVFGLVSLDRWDQRMQSWDVRQIGLVQPNDAVTLDVPEPPKGFSREYPEEMAATERLAQAGADVVVWPESRYKGYFDLYSVRLGYIEAVRKHCVSLIFHDAESAWYEGEEHNYNSVVHLDEEGDQLGVYRKMLRMPFGEYLPAFFHLPGVSWLTQRFFGEFLRPLQAGTVHEIFEVKGMRMVPKICYETAFPRFIANSIGSDAAGKVLLFVSQDNWFGESTQPFQHSAMSVVRAVENRVPMIHLINNGPSVVAGPNGRLIASTEAFVRSEQVVAMPYSETSGGSLYSRHPLLVKYFMYSVLALLILAGSYKRFRLRLDQTDKPAL